jgi:predicted NUDIX family phosphoesterase
MENHALVIKRKDFDAKILAAKGNSIPLIHWPAVQEDLPSNPSGYDFAAVIDSNHVLYGLDTELRDRAIADHKEIIDSDNLQLLPYVVLFHVDDLQERRYFTYKRGEVGTEKRLHGNHSIGVGGHIEVVPDAETPLFRLIVEDAAREIKEEVGVVFDDDAQEENDLTYSSLRLSKALDKAVLFQDSTNNVGKAHLGIFMFVQIDQMKVGELENNVVTDSAWLTADQLSEIKLENWTAAALYLHQYLYVGNYKPSAMVKNFGHLDGTVT